MHILHVVGARPNFMKVAPVYRALQDSGCRQTLVHTGQHYDLNMSGVFFQQLGIPEPNENLAVGSGSHACQTAEVMMRFEPVVDTQRPDMVLVYGDVNSTMAAALVCSKLHVPVGHVEAGLRSFDRTMPEEINRLVTDQLADLHFTPSEDADQNLLNEGIAPGKIRFVGNVMIDTVVRLLPAAAQALPHPVPDRFGLVTLHRPSNVDDPSSLRQIFEALLEISYEVEILFPVHPRTRQRISELGFDGLRSTRLHLVEPAPYLEFLALQQRAAFAVTDSGGIQEETTFLGVPCLTLRESTERPVTVTRGTNILVGKDMQRLRDEVSRILRGEVKHGEAPPLWDGHAGERIAHALHDYHAHTVTQACVE